MKIGIITFHWATNYGAVLQAFALYTYLKNLGHEVEIIDYYPSKYKKNIFRAIATRHVSSIPKRIKAITKEQQIEIFRKENLQRSRYYSSSVNLRKHSSVYDCYICGSDQIWNMSFLRYGERKKTYTYFLDFAPEEKILASYAASFGTEVYAEDLKKDIKRYLERFDFISVREQTGLNIVNELGFKNACIVPDPTMLLSKSYYEKFINKTSVEGTYVYSYMLHGRKHDADILFSLLKNAGINVISNDNCGIEEWLTDIYYSKIVITNSFHGIVFSIILEKPFVAVLVEGSGMNDRIITLLNELDLSNRIFKGNVNIINETIDWGKVSDNLNEYRTKGISFINKILSYRKGYN